MVEPHAHGGLYVATHKWPLDLVHMAMHGVPQPLSNLEDLIWKDYNKKAFSLH